MNLDIFLNLGVSLTLTLVLESCYAILYHVRGSDLRLVLLVNVLTNPVVVLCHQITGRFWPAGLGLVILVMELWAVGIEGYLYYSRGNFKHPWRFSVCANLLSYMIGYLLQGGLR